MKIINERPPEWIMQGCLSQFRVNVDRTFWTYGTTIFNPGGSTLPPDLLAHEETHSQQQSNRGLMLQYLKPEERIDDDALPGKMVDAWWRTYLAEPRFRLEQEAEAYGEQYRFFCKHVSDRNKRAMFLRQIAKHFSGPLYQLALTYEQARAMILVLSGQRSLDEVK